MAPGGDAQRRVRFKTNRELPPAAEGIEAPYDPDARYRHKRDTQWTGYTVHVSETCEPTAPHLLTHVHTTTAAVHEAQCTAPIHQALAEKNLLLSEQLVDAAYIHVDCPPVRWPPPLPCRVGQQYRNICDRALWRRIHTCQDVRRDRQYRRRPRSGRFELCSQANQDVLLSAVSVQVVDSACTPLSTRARKASRASHDWKWAACPETTCSTRPTRCPASTCVSA